MSIVLVTGGARSGKSSYALQRAEAYGRKGFIATAIAFDDEIKARIDKHRADRDVSYETIEAPHDLAAALRLVPDGTQVVVLDCLTVWLGNLMHRHGEKQESYEEVSEFLDELSRIPYDLIVVGNEVGMGIVPEYASARRFRDLAGTVNQRVGSIADEVVFVVSGQAMMVKG